MRHHLSSSFVYCCLFVLFFAPDAQAQTKWVSPMTGNWTNGANWISGAAPTSSDDVLIDAFGSPFTITLNTNAVVNHFSLQSPDATFNMRNRTFESVTGASIGAGTVVLSNTTWNGGTIENSGTLFANTDRINTVNLNGGLVNNAGSEFTIRSWGSGSFFGRTTVNVNNSLDNSGLIKLRTSPSGPGATATLNVNSGTLTNQVGGVIEAAIGESPGGHSRNINALNLVNHGTIVNNDASLLNFFKADSTIENTGTLDFAVGAGRFQSFAAFDNQTSGLIKGQSVTLQGRSAASSAITNSGNIDLDNGDLVASSFQTFNNSGTIDVSAGNMSFAGAGTTTNFVNSGVLKSAVGQSIGFASGNYIHEAGGSITGGGSLVFNNTDVVLNSDLNLTGPNTIMLNMIGSGVGRVINQAGSLTRIDSSTFSNHFVNNGDLQISYDRINVVNTTNGFTNNSTGEVLIRSWGSGSFSGRSTLNLGNSNFVNYGTLAFAAAPGNANATSRLSLGSGVLVNHGTVEFRAPESNGNAAYFIDGELINYGSLLNFSGTNIRLTQTNASHQNLGRLSLIGGDLTVQGSNSTFVNTISGLIDGNHRLTLGSGMTLINEGEIAPGSSPGQLTIAGNVDFETSSLMSIELAGLMLGTEYDNLSVTGTWDIEGRLVVSLLDGFRPDEFDLFTIGTASTITGQFDNLINDQVFLAGGGRFDVIMNSGSVQLGNFSAIPEPTALPLLALFSLCLSRRRSKRSSVQVMKPGK